MAAQRPKGSIILEILIVLVSLLLIAVIIIPNKIWEKEEKVTKACRNNLTTIYEAERFFYRATESYTDTLSKLLTFVQNDSGLQQRQSIVSLTRSFIQVVDNILSIPSIEQISTISQAAFEITGDLIGNERYFRKYENVASLSKEINHEIMQMDSSATFPNFSRVKLFVDSLRSMKEKVSDYSLQNSVLHALNYVDSILVYFPQYEKSDFTDYWNAEYKKINSLIDAIRKTDIVKVSSVHDRLKKFIDRINTSVNTLNNTDLSLDQNQLQSERENMAALHEKFLSPEYFMISKKYGLTALSEVDSLLINFTEENFSCPDCQEPYIISIDSNKITVECPNLLSEFQQKFIADIEPVKDLPYIDKLNQLDTIIAQTKEVMEKNRVFIRRKTDILLSLKELQAEMRDLSNVFFYKYSHDYQNFVKTLETENKLSVLKPMIEDILNPIDTLATRIKTGNIKDLEDQINYFNKKLKQLDSMITVTRLPASTRRRIISHSETFAPALEIVSQIKSSFDQAFAQALTEAGHKLEQDLLKALEGVEEPIYLIFTKKHINHGSIVNGEKSWEQ